MYIYSIEFRSRFICKYIKCQAAYPREISKKSCMFHCYIVIDDDGELFLLHEGKKRTQNSNILGFPQKKRARGAPLDTL